MARGSLKTIRKSHEINTKSIQPFEKIITPANEKTNGVKNKKLA